jgi:hypothetical protein
VQIRSISAQGINPIRHLAVNDLSDIVVVAGPNGVGKTRFLRWLLDFLQNLPSGPDNWIIVEATSPEERTGSRRRRVAFACYRDITLKTISWMSSLSREYLNHWRTSRHGFEIPR